MYICLSYSLYLKPVLLFKDYSGTSGISSKAHEPAKLSTCYHLVKQWKQPINVHDAKRMELDGHTGLEHFIIKKQIFFGYYAFDNALTVSRGKDRIKDWGGGWIGTETISGNLPLARRKYSIC